jgi:modulator of FtsH protease HflC
MKNLVSVIFVVLIVAVLLLYLVCFQVRETESALVTTFGKPDKAITEPGLNFKWPAPIQVVYKFDSRLRVFEGVVEETPTRGGEPIVMTAYIVWRIAEPLKFFQAVGNDQRAQDHLSNQLRDKRNSIIGQHYFNEFVNSDPNKIRFGDIEEQIKHELYGPVLANYGIEIKDVGIKQLGVSEKVTQDVFDRMRADRKRKTDSTIAAGTAEATRIRSDADSKKTELLVTAEARAKAIRGQGDAEAAQYYKQLEEDPELAIFLRKTEGIKKMLKDRSTIVISAESEPFELLRAMPKIEPNQSKDSGAAGLKSR